MNPHSKRIIRRHKRGKDDGKGERCHIAGERFRFPKGLSENEFRERVLLIERLWRDNEEFCFKIRRDSEWTDIALWAADHIKKGISRIPLPPIDDVLRSYGDSEFHIRIKLIMDRWTDETLHTDYPHTIDGLDWDEAKAFFDVLCEAFPSVNWLLPIDAKVKMKYRPFIAWNNLDGSHCKKLLENGIMSNFFKGWRRKVGVAMLAVALVFMAGWIRSQSTSDMLMYPAGKDAIDRFFSVKGLLVWQLTEIAYQRAELQNVAPLGSTDLTHPTWQASPVSEDDSIEDLGLNWRWRFCGFGVAESPTEADGETVLQSLTFLFIPYWSIVIPMTLISAYLLLIKPRSREQKNSVEQISAMAA